MPRPYVYRLYRWKVKPLGIGRFQFTRSKCIGMFDSYHAMLARARKLASAAGYPQRAWEWLFDWNKE